MYNVYVLLIYISITRFVKVWRSIYKRDTNLTFFTSIKSLENFKTKDNILNSNPTTFQNISVISGSPHLVSKRWKLQLQDIQRNTFGHKLIVTVRKSNYTIYNWRRVPLTFFFKSKNPSSFVSGTSHEHSCLIYKCFDCFICPTPRFPQYFQW